MKIKNDPGKIRKMEKEEAKMKKEFASMKREEAKKEMEAAKKESDLEKYRIVLEKLQLNWIKWNITSITIGFAAYKFYHSRVDYGEKPIGGYVNGWHIGVFLISFGFITLLVATLQHRKNIAKLKLQFETMPYSLSLRVSYFMMAFSIFILLLVIFKG